MATIDDKMINFGADVFYTKPFRDMIEAHIQYLNTHANTIKIMVDEHSAVVYKGDLFGYLNKVKIPAYLHWIVLRMNNMYSNFDFNPSITELLIPDNKVVDKLRQQHMSKTK